MRLLIGTAALVVILGGLWALDQRGGRALAEERIRIAAEELVRDSVRRLSAPWLDARGRPKARLAVRLESRGHETCRAALAKAVLRDPVLVPDEHAETRLRASCRVEAPAGPDPISAVVRLDLRLLDVPEGQPRPNPVRAAQQLVGYLALVPPLVAVILALATGRILLSLALAIFAAAIVAVLGRPDRLGAPLASQLLGLPGGLAEAAWHGARRYVVEPTFGQFKLQIMAFASALVGMVAVIARAGGIKGLLGLVSRLQGSPRLTRLSVFLMGVVIFFDDCANTLVVGSTARPLTDAARVSREKLAYLVDSTAAPIAGVAIISTWIGFEVGLFQTTADALGLGMSGFELFFAALPLRFYCLLTLAFVLLSIGLDRDYGAMLAAERRALATGVVSARAPEAADDAALAHERPPEGLAPAWSVAVLPIAAVIASVLGGILLLGHTTAGVQAGLRDGLYGAGSLAWLRECFTYAAKDELQGWALLAAGLAGAGLALFLARRRRRTLGPAAGNALTYRDLGLTFFRGMRAIGGAIGILVGAWAIQAACESLGTSVVLTAALSGAVDPHLLPLIIFATSAGIAFATGTSWGTMGILIPAVLPLAHALGGAEDPVLLYLAAGAVLDGAIFGDHCSPISDTTVMSSLSSGCHHLDHVRTQLPYAVTVMLVAALGGYLARALGAPLWACYGMSVAALLAVLLALGRRPGAAPRAA